MSSKTPHLALTTISNVRLHVPVQLSLSQPNYKKWSRLFLLLVRRFNLQGYLDGSVAPLSDDDDEWCQLDALLKGWILSTITDEVSDLIISSLTTASALWKIIHDLFHDNKHARAMQLEHEFRTTVKGSTSMAAYCQQLQNLADWFDRLSCFWITNGQTPLTPAPRPCSLTGPAANSTAGHTVAAAAMVDRMAATATMKGTRDSAEAMDVDKDVAVEIGVVDVDVKTALSSDKPMTEILPGTHLTQTPPMAC
ncbi:unnamed protein product [Cuscuta campestris]|uniref:Retrotransposon Copia-like N-terminal domain-containing protein n=1 Tax=Cuscuta campestris TaxID=132261 RepID=A0A484KPJ1_9ASTE|nr:unnamed protein product [Cuscuta campestris]